MSAKKKGILLAGLTQQVLGVESLRGGPALDVLLQGQLSARPLLQEETARVSAVASCPLLTRCDEMSSEEEEAANQREKLSHPQGHRRCPGLQSPNAPCPAQSHRDATW